MAKGSPKSLDDIFGEQSPQKAQRPQSLDDIFGSPSGKPSAMPFEMREQPSAKSLEPAAEALGSIPLGMYKTATMGYGPLPKRLEQAMENNPGLTTIGNFMGAALPGSAIGKGVQTGAKAIAPALAKSSTGIGALIGGLEGALYNPGEGGSRLNNMLMGLGVGGGLGMGAGVLKRAGDKVALLDELENPENFSRKVQGKINTGIENIKSKIPPLKSKLLESLKDKKVQINPEELRGWSRPKTRGTPGEKPGFDPVSGLEKKIEKTFPEETFPKTTQTKMGGGLDRLAYKITEKPPSSPGRQVRDIPAKQAQRMKEYFDRLTDYQAERMYQEGAKASEDRAFSTANKLREKLAQSSPEVGPLNEQMSKMYKLISQIKKMSEGGPLSTISSNPMTDRGQLLKEFDAAAGTDLGKLGELLSSAKKIAPSDPTRYLKPLESVDAKLDTAQRGLGRVYNKVTVRPEENASSMKKLISKAKETGPDALILSILENARKNRTEFTPEDE